jgi:hypothetical protein
MHPIKLFCAVLCLIAVGGCSVDDNGVAHLSFAGDGDPSPTSGYQIMPGTAAHNDAYMNPYDPADQQQNQGHGLTVGPDDPAYFAGFGRF